MFKLSKTKTSRTEPEGDFSVSRDNHFKNTQPESRRTRGTLAGRLRYRGMAMIWVAIFLLLFILLVGLSLDTAKGLLIAHQLQNAADAAALAGAVNVRIDQDYSKQKAIEVAFENYADGDPVQLEPDGMSADVIIGRYYRQRREFIPGTHAANAIKVIARRTETSLNGLVSLNFGSIVGVDTANVFREAIAMASGGTGAGLIVLAEEYDPDGPARALDVRGDLIIDVNNGDIQVNSPAVGPDSNKSALTISGNSATFLADEVNIQGDAHDTGPDQWDPDFPVNFDMPPIPDPLCPSPETGDCIPPPGYNPDLDLTPDGETIRIDSNGLPGTYEPNGIAVVGPGYYSGGFKILAGANVIFKPGIYILGGGLDGKGGLDVRGNSSICAKGVMFYITNSHLSGEYGKLNLGGGGEIRITPLDPENTEFCGAYSYPEGIDFGTYEGISIFQDRENLNEAVITGNDMMDLDGTLYFPKNHLELGGTGLGFGNQLIAWTMYIHGTGVMGINYDGRNRSAGNRSFLVE